MSKLSETAFGAAWLARFPEEEKATASALMDEVLLVNAPMFSRWITASVRKILDDAPDTARPVALYAEREIETDRTQDGEEYVLPFWPNCATGRATGEARPSIIFDPESPEVGSEGTVANQITNLCRFHKGRVISHPGPDTLRSQRAWAIVLVTDFIGSGQRISEMLEAFRAVASIRSWRSYRKLRFYVIAYSGTEEGIRRVEKNNLEPKVLLKTGCPTIRRAFAGQDLISIESLCREYPRKNRFPFGYSDSGALIAFGHGIPNNAPPILHSTARNWTPLFRGRSTVGGELHFPDDEAANLAKRINRLLKIRDAQKYLARTDSRLWVTVVVVLKAVARGATGAGNISAQTGLSLAEVDEVLRVALTARWITRREKLTLLGRRELARLRQRRERAPILPSRHQPFYYPSQLRAK